MTLSAETRRMLELSRAADIPLPSRERAVRDRLIAELGAAALTGVVASTAVVTAQTAGATTSGALSASGSSSAAAGSGTKALAGATTSTLTKLAALIVAAGIGAGAWNHPDVAERAEAWSAEIAVDAKRVARRAWRLITGGGDAETTSRGALESVDRSVDFDERRHALLIAIARRPNRPVAKEAELVLILRAEQALVSGDDTRAAQYLDAHEMSFEAGALEADREALRVLVDCARGDAPAARARAARFVAWFASSDQLARLKACPFTASIVEERTLPSPAALPSAGAPPVAADESKF
jgi:hypothetical protein